MSQYGLPGGGGALPLKRCRLSRIDPLFLRLANIEKTPHFQRKYRKDPLFSMTGEIYRKYLPFCLNNIGKAPSIQ